MFDLFRSFASVEVVTGDSSPHPKFIRWEYNQIGFSFKFQSKTNVSLNLVRYLIAYRCASIGYIDCHCVLFKTRMCPGVSRLVFLLLFTLLFISRLIYFSSSCLVHIELNVTLDFIFVCVFFHIGILYAFFFSLLPLPKAIRISQKLNNNSKKKKDFEPNKNRIYKFHSRNNKKNKPKNSTRSNEIENKHTIARANEKKSC